MPKGVVGFMTEADMKLLDPKPLETIERRAQNAVNGYAADVNITCYVYGADVCALLNERRRLLAIVDRLRTENAHLMQALAKAVQPVENVPVPVDHVPTVQVTGHTGMAAGARPSQKRSQGKS